MAKCALKFENAAALSASLISPHLAKAPFQHRLFTGAPTAPMKSPVTAFSTNQGGIFPVRCPERPLPLPATASSCAGLEATQQRGQGRVRHEVTASEQKPHDQEEAYPSPYCCLIKVNLTHVTLHMKSENESQRE